MKDGRDEPKIYVDEDGKEWIVNEDGSKSVPMRIRREPETKSYDTSRGHCGLCGSLTCTGKCFK